MESERQKCRPCRFELEEVWCTTQAGHIGYSSWFASDPSYSGGVPEAWRDQTGKAMSEYSAPQVAVPDLGDRPRKVWQCFRFKS